MEWPGRAQRYLVGLGREAVTSISDSGRTSWINENARIEQALRIEDLLRSAQRLGEQRRALPVIPRAMVATDRVVMRDGPTIRNHGVERRALDCEPLRAELARLAKRVDGEIRRRPVGIYMGEAAGD